jgi:hypothetical protein
MGAGNPDLYVLPKTAFGSSAAQCPTLVSDRQTSFSSTMSSIAKREPAFHHAEKDLQHLQKPECIGTFPYLVLSHCHPVMLHHHFSKSGSFRQTECVRASIPHTDRPSFTSNPFYLRFPSSINGVRLIVVPLGWTVIDRQGHASWPTRTGLASGLGGLVLGSDVAEGFAFSAAMV